MKYYSFIVGNFIIKLEISITKAGKTTTKISHKQIKQDTITI
jgi:hypothetical protein